MDGEFLIGSLWGAQPGQRRTQKGTHHWCVGMRHVQLAHLAVATLSVGCLRAANIVGAAAARENSTLSLGLTGGTGNLSQWQISGLDYRIHGALMSSYLLGHALSPLPLHWLLRWASSASPRPGSGSGSGSAGLRAAARLCGLRPTPLLAAALIAGAASALAMPSLLVRGQWSWSCLVSALGGAGAALAAPAGPALAALLGRWVPPGEDTVAVNVVCYCVQAGLALGVWACGSVTSLWLGWRAPWLLGGGAALTAAVCVALLTDDEPDKHPAVGEAEKQWIKDAISQKNGEDECSEDASFLWSVLRSGPVWGAVASRATVFTVFFILLMYGSDYLKVTGVNPKETTRILSRSLMYEMVLATVVLWLAQQLQPELERRGCYWKLLNGLGTVVELSILMALANDPSGVRAQYLFRAALVSHGLILPWAMESVRDSLMQARGARVTQAVQAVQAASGGAALLAAGGAAGAGLLHGMGGAGDTDKQWTWRWLFLSLAALLVLGQAVHWMLTPSLQPPAKGSRANDAAATELDTMSNARLLEKDG